MEKTTSTLQERMQSAGAPKVTTPQYTTEKFKGFTIQKRTDIKMNTCLIYQGEELKKCIAGDILPDGTENSIAKAKQWITNQWAQFASHKGQDGVQWHNFKHTHKDELGKKWTVGTGFVVDITDTLKGIVGRIDNNGRIQVFPINNKSSKLLDTVYGTIQEVLTMRYRKA